MRTEISNQTCKCVLHISNTFSPLLRYAKKDTVPAGTEDTEKVGTKGKRKVLDEDTQDLEEPAAKHTKV
jgi:hypothetical protein